MIQDRLCRRLVGDKPRLAVAWWLMASYAYYECDDPILSDAVFDELTAILASKPELRVEHRHGHLITDGMLATGSAVGLTQYPSITRYCAEAMMKGTNRSGVRTPTAPLPTR